MKLVKYTSQAAKKVLPRRLNASNKATHGRTAIFAGSRGMGGAAILSGVAASRVGSGYVQVVTNGDPRKILSRAPEFLTASLKDTKIWKKPKWNAAVIGPGFGVGAHTEKTLTRLSRLDLNGLVVDADALTAIAKRKKYRKVNRNWILTPHAGELSRLLSVSAKKIEADRVRYVKEAAKKYGCIVLLKGYRTLVCDGDTLIEIQSGNAALAKAGTGDVLSGMIAGFLAQGLEPFSAACLGAYMHGRIADDWLKSKRDILSLQPSDLLEALPFVLKKVRS